MTHDTLQTPLHAAHIRLGARMVPFAGWNMPVQYRGTLSEAAAVRKAAGIFDVSHMGRFIAEGADARALLNWVHTADIGEAMPAGRARYGLFLNEAGGIIDDGVVYRLNDQRFLIVANAANAAQIFAWLGRWRDGRWSNTNLVDLTSHVAMIALQGPDAIRVATAVFGFNPDATRAFRIAEHEFDGHSTWIARTGYTGEDGVEIMPPSGQAENIWEVLRGHGAVPCGLGARDTLRLEAGLRLHGNDMSNATNPIEAGLERFVTSSGEFCGADAVNAARKSGLNWLLVGYRTSQRGPVPRQHTLIFDGKQQVGEVTSGGFSPSLDTNIGLGYVRPQVAVPGRHLHAEVRGRLVEIETVHLPFYTRPQTS